MVEKGIKQVDSEDELVDYIIEEYELEEGETINVLNKLNA